MKQTMKKNQHVSTNLIGSPRQAPIPTIGNERSEVPLHHDIHADLSILENQPTINIGTIGHVAHGKSSLVRSITGTATGRHNQERMKNMTIKLGYANVKIYECENKACPRPDRFSAAPSWMTGKLRCARDGCNSDMRLVRHVSFVDCPGHEVLMATMLNGAAVMDASILVVAANVPCPQPQTEEHTIAVSVTGMKPLITVQNKIDLVSKTHATENYQQILTHLGNYGYPKNVPIIPTSAVGGLNMDVLIETIARLPTPVRDTTAPAFMLIIRSFDVNKPGASIDSLTGGVAGGSLLRGKLRIDEEIEIRPGLITKTAAGDIFVKPLRTKVRALLSETNKLGTAWPGGLIGVGTGLDPTLTKGDRLVGHVLGHAGTLPPVYSTIVVSYYMMKRLVGAASVGADGKRSSRPAKLAKGDEIKVNIHSRTARARVLAVKEDLVRLSLEIPCCMEDNQRIAINRRVENTNKWALVAFGAFLKEQSKPLELQI